MNKEEIEKAKQCLNEIIQNTYAEGKTKKLDILRKYIKELEQKESILDKVTDKLKETVKKERQLMPYLPHKSASFHYANGREVLAKEILEFIEGEKK